MKSKWVLLSLVMLLVVGLVSACGGGDDDDDTADDDVTDDDVADDDVADDDIADDDIVDDDIVDDDIVDDDIVDDDIDTEYDTPEWYCILPDPASLGDGITVGGGAISDDITVYVYDGAVSTDGTYCDPIEGAHVILDNTEVGTTNTDGMLVIDLADAAELVTAFMPGYWSWSYEADAAVMYFRLRPDNYDGFDYQDSNAGEFLLDGTALGLENFNIEYSGINIFDPVGQLLDSVIAGGVAIPGLARSTLLDLDFDGMISDGMFEVSYEYFIVGSPPEGDIIELWRSIYLPGFLLDVNVIGLAGVTAEGDDNSEYLIRIPDPVFDENPIEGFTFDLALGEAVTTNLIGNLLLDLIMGNPIDIIEIIMDNLVPLLNNAIAFGYVGADPVWDGSGAPDIEVTEVGTKLNVPLTISNYDSDFDYMSVLAAEIPNRALLPLGIQIADAGAAVLDAAEVADADYVIAALKTDLLASELTSFNMSLAMAYAETLDDWSADGVTIADGDFLPFFDSANCAYNDTTGEITWQLESKADVDLYLAVYIPACEDCPVVLATLPGTAGSYQPPIAALGITPTPTPALPDIGDIAVVVGIDLPEGVSADEFDPTHILSYNSTGLNLWTNVDIIALLENLLNPAP